MSSNTPSGLTAAQAVNYYKQKKNAVRKAFQKWIKARSQPMTPQSQVDHFEKQILQLDPRAKKQVAKIKKESPTLAEATKANIQQTLAQQRIQQRNTQIQEGTTGLPPLARKPMIANANRTRIRNQGIRSGTQTRRRRS